MRMGCFVLVTLESGTIRGLEALFCRYKGSPQKSNKFPPGLNREAIDSGQSGGFHLQRLAVLQSGSPAVAATFIKRESDLWRSIAKQVNMVPGSM